MPKKSYAMPGNPNVAPRKPRKKKKKAKGKMSKPAVDYSTGLMRRTPFKA